MDIVIITGMSGAGKTSVLNICQDNDYYSIDNIPPKLINEYFDLIKDDKGHYNKFAFVIDVRVGGFLEDLEDEIIKLRNDGHNVKVIFLDALDEVLIRRFQEKRRPHYFKSLTLSNAIALERETLLNVREFTDIYIDTSGNNLSALNSKMLDVLGVGNEANIQIVSFGFKYGTLIEADFLFDVRFIDNPFYIPEMKENTGKDKNVSEYVLGFEVTKQFLDNVEELINTVVPHFVQQSKNNLVIGIGCTGGKHRSVAITEELNLRLSRKYNTSVFHRERKNW
ncbi:RNase adapter RapZ [Helcococcus kunzii]|uniref:Uncharacterized protein n=1 Tax=Helcococcus kunzii ATCC 51366 TaxID=883114 RepID=H3NLA6_9FIRM|nr:RNase adapter RapZ [Helcococcus kunzii]EHR36087.1 hypothetical protein HMPREF9709_00183 [Helcococcus kunzii ATCC 51366]MCT1796661.1 RNase adapter RapZ [Helcococcus kunzii]MCT1988695.1 RNase adapter RapZ [Helcococcus kunzii]QUY64121.1 RNase adapter RapZ [Helcococcus kunzii]QZO76575.1 RNase adapter RapZ [Helcococcus kunzii]